MACPWQSRGRVGGLNPNQRRTPDEAAAERFQQHELPTTHAPVGHRFRQSQGNGGGGGIGMAIDWLVPHQANIRIIEGMGRKLGLAPERVVITVDRHANTSAASIPLALAEAMGDGRIRHGQLVLMEALGGGLVWGSALVRI